MIEERECVGRRVPKGEGAAGRRLAEPALVPPDAAELLAQRRHLRIEHRLIHQEAMAEDHRGSLAAAVLVVDVLPVDVGKSHRPHRTLSDAMPLPPEFHELARKVNNWGRWGDD